MMLQPIGHGAFGEVWLAKAQGILEFKAEASSMSPTKRKRFSRLFSNNSTYDNVEMLKNLSLAKVAVKTLKGQIVKRIFQILSQNKNWQRNVYHLVYKFVAKHESYFKYS